MAIELGKLTLGVLFLAPCLVHQSVQADPKRYAIVSHHNTGGPGTQKLQFAQHDAQLMANTLVELAGVQAQDISLLNRPTVGDITQALEAVSVEITQSQEEAWLVFYYSGHADEYGLWLGQEHLPLADLKAMVSASNAHIQLMILDACASGALTREKGGKRTHQFLVKVEENPELQGQIILASSSADEASQESTRLGAGIFTHHLVSGMRGAADLGLDGVVTLDEAYRYAYHNTLYDTSDSLAGAQHPTYKVDLSGRGELILSRPRLHATSLLFPGGSSGTYLVFEKQQRRFVSELHLDGTATQIGLPPGQYLVQKRQSDHLLAAEVTLNKGTSARLEESDMTRRSFQDDFTKGVIAANKLRAMGPRLTVQSTVAMQAFFDTPVREELVPSTPLYGLSVQWAGWPSAMFALRGELAYGSLNTVQVIDQQPFPIHFSEMALSAALLRLKPMAFLSLYGGIRGSFLYLSREFEPPLVQEKQTFANLSPGALAGLNIPLAGPFGLNLEGRAHYLYYYAGEDNLSLGFAELALGLWGKF